MKKLTIILVLMFICMMTGCATKSDNNSTGKSSELEHDDYSHVKDSEKKHGKYKGKHGEYTIAVVDPNSELAEEGVFRKHDNGNYSLLVNLGVGSHKRHWEDDCLYIVTNYLTKYNLAAEDPESTKESLQILPSLAEVNYIYSFDEEWIYLSARLWNEEEARHDLECTYAVRRDGTEYKEIPLEDIPQ